VISKYLAAASALALLPAPALAQHTGHGGMTMPMPESKKAAPTKKKSQAKKSPTKVPASKPATKAEKAAAPAEQMPAAVDHSTMGRSQMEQGSMPMPTEPTPATTSTPMDHSQMDHATMDHQMSAGEGHAGHGAMTGALAKYPMNREASGTAWQPDASEHGGIHIRSGDWTLMGHGTFNLVFDHQSGPRGDDKTFLSGHLIGTARRPLGNGTLQFRAALSPDPQMGARGYPLLLASGETANGTERLIDRQHPHDLFVELSASASQNISPTASLFLYAALPGEPAFGPPVYLHRAAIMDSPEAPISHHWLDSTHISFGVLTAGVVVDRLKLEVSRFNGREPDQHRWNFETGPLDSTAVRLSWNPTANWSLQGSWGHFENSEQLEPGVDQKRWSASALYAREIASGWTLAGTLAWGRKTIEGNKDDAAALEASLKHGRWTIFTRGEITENRELSEDPDEHGPAFTVGKVSLGAVRDFAVANHLALGVGGLFAVNFVPDDLKPLYGGNNPIGTMAFIRLKVE
jgi:hypothetical protein